MEGGGRAGGHSVCGRRCTGSEAALPVPCKDSSWGGGDESLPKRRLGLRAGGDAAA